MSDTNSQYFDAYAAIMKITLRDGDATNEEQQFLQRLGKKLGVTSEEYFELIESYLRYKITAPYTYDERLESMYRLSEIVYNDEILSNELKENWLQRMGIAIGLDPSYVANIVSKSLEFFKSSQSQKFKDYKSVINR